MITDYAQCAECDRAIHRDHTGKWRHSAPVATDHIVRPKIID